MSDSTAPDAAPELIDRLRLIEEQPLETRAAAYSSVYDELARRLEQAPTESSAPSQP